MANYRENRQLLAMMAATIASPQFAWEIHVDETAVPAERKAFLAGEALDIAMVILELIDSRAQSPPPPPPVGPPRLIPPSRKGL